ncbi:MAG: exopolysaccharide biosynthesis polyprenyl glycosylphosphotransferase [Isosphaeraceae bacterium]|nr:exopolysaccharide biosynthesis polyprenyl glycosylphosphotransferase [Isosphaeraceae bacterium]
MTEAQVSASQPCTNATTVMRPCLGSACSELDRPATARISSPDGWPGFKRASMSWGRALKRGMDVLGSLVGLVLLAPLFALVALAIRVTSGGPVLFLQERVGEGEKRFWMYKFRSMKRDAERATGPIWASAEDARCTTVGAWLRRYNLDELPQLINVLAGEMSLVGPRPERPVFVEQFAQAYPAYRCRHSVPVGMTGWAQVHGWRGRTSLQKRLEFDLDYVDRWTFALDLVVLARTVQHVLFGKTTWSSRERPTQALQPSEIAPALTSGVAN